MGKTTQEELKEILHYDPLTGIFTWKVDAAKNVKKGSEAGYLKPNGYIHIVIQGQNYLAHRLAWLYVHGYFPEHGLDHRDRDGAHNWILNLREATVTCNARNCKVRITNKTGVTGVCFDKHANKFRAQIQVNGKAICLGHFTNLIDATEARWNAEVKYDFPNCNTTSSAYLYLQKESRI